MIDVCSLTALCECGEVHSFYDSVIDPITDCPHRIIVGCDCEGTAVWYLLWVLVGNKLLVEISLGITSHSLEALAGGEGFFLPLALSE